MNNKKAVHIMPIGGDVNSFKRREILHFIL